MDIIANKQELFSNTAWIFEAMKVHAAEIDVYEAGCELLFFGTKWLRQEGEIDTIFGEIASNLKRPHWNYEDSDKFHENMLREFKTESKKQCPNDYLEAEMGPLKAFKHSRIWRNTNMYI